MSCSVLQRVAVCLGEWLGTNIVTRNRFVRSCFFFGDLRASACAGGCVWHGMRVNVLSVFVTEWFNVRTWRSQEDEDIGWLQVVGSLKLYVSFAEHCPFYRALLQKRPIILKSLLIVANPYRIRHDIYVWMSHSTTSKGESRWSR